MPPIKEQFQTALKESAARGVKLCYVAKQSGIAGETLTNIRVGQRSTTLAVGEKIAAALGYRLALVKVDAGEAEYLKNC